ncbi:endonuclease III [Deferribacter desulfuricans SSM1]|uniref:Endonuclease III n=1 Tax=Deferribacter desulfuricans (strain DSM 14783 / JCM 11476 / NBRC 101012 / SSM1) TaxID=639282 RepID=D3PCH1_DEFDS|nr:endonuclease III domain-containing protein [Deferribacter desulfuricans]BAI80294.1 endonuclease III [Deferribacter desulfuricans SSM1]
MLNRLYNILFANYGDLNWWPAETPFEVCIGAILTQNTNWKNVEKAINNMKIKGVLSPKEILNTDLNVLKDLIKPAGFYNQKAERLQIFCNFIMNQLNGDILNLKKYSIHEARDKLLSLKGVGKETADSILLYALDFKIFVVDAYTMRLFRRYGIGYFDNYDKCQDFVHKDFHGELYDYKNFHACIVEICKTYCKKKPLCNICLLKKYCKKVLE